MAERKNRRNRVESDHLFSENQENKNKITVSSLKKIYPLTQNQELFFNNYRKNNAFVLHGMPGTGKTLIAVYNALLEVLTPNSDRKKVIIVRSAVPSREIGHLPGNEKEKTEIYSQPYKEIAADLFPKFGDKAFGKLKEQGIIDFMVTSYVRGLTLDNAVVIVDEIQNMTWQELNSIFTRIGENTKIIFCGDVRQTDLGQKKTDQSGLGKFMQVIDHMEDDFFYIDFEVDDIVRSELVKKFIIATVEWEKQNP